jgi:hypothetical protein
MFSFFKKIIDQHKLYQETDFSFKYPDYMEMGIEGDMSISFFKKENPTGVFRMSRVLLKESGQHFDELLNQNIKSLEEDRIKYDAIRLSDLKGIMFEKRSPFNAIDEKYWILHDDLSKTTERASMETGYWQLGNANVYFYFSYRYPTVQTAEGQASLEEEKNEVFRLIRSLRLH